MEEAEDHLAELFLDMECLCQGMEKYQGSDGYQVDDGRKLPTATCSMQTLMTIFSYPVRQGSSRPYA